MSEQSYESGAVSPEEVGNVQDAPAEPTLDSAEEDDTQGHLSGALRQERRESVSGGDERMR